MLAQAVRFSTHHLTEAQRSTRWEEWNSAALIGLSCDTPHGRGLRAEETTLDLPDVTLGRVQAEPHRVRRSSETVDRFPTDSLVVYAILQGRTIFSDGHGSQLLRAGDLAILDADRPFVRHFPTQFAELALKVPRHLFDGRVSGTPSVGPHFIRSSGLSALRIKVLGRHLEDPALPVPAAQAEAICRIALDLLTDLTTSEGPGDRLALARVLIDQNLSDQSLSASRVAGALQISQRQLSRLFADAATSFPKYLTDRRMQLAATILSQPAVLPMGEVARLCGFSSATYFSRVFREHHGTTAARFRLS